MGLPVPLGLDSLSHRKAPGAINAMAFMVNPARLRVFFIWGVLWVCSLSTLLRLKDSLLIYDAVSFFSSLCEFGYVFRWIVQ